MTYTAQYQNYTLFCKNMISVFITLPLSKLHPLSQFLLPPVVRLKNPVNQHFYNKIQHFCITILFLRLLVLYSILQTRKMTISNNVVSVSQTITVKVLLLKFKNSN